MEVLQVISLFNLKENLLGLPSHLIPSKKIYPNQPFLPRPVPFSGPFPSAPPALSLLTFLVSRSIAAAFSCAACTALFCPPSYPHGQLAPALSPHHRGAAQNRETMVRRARGGMGSDGRRWSAEQGHVMPLREDRSEDQSRSGRCQIEMVEASVCPSGRGLGPGGGGWGSRSGGLVLMLCPRLAGSGSRLRMGWAAVVHLSA